MRFIVAMTLVLGACGVVRPADSGYHIDAGQPGGELGPAIVPPTCPVLFTYVQEWEISEPQVRLDQFLVLTTQGVNLKLDTLEIHSVRVTHPEVELAARLNPEFDSVLRDGYQIGGLGELAEKVLRDWLPRPYIPSTRSLLDIGIGDLADVQVVDDVVSVELKLRVEANASSDVYRIHLHLRLWPGQHSGRRPMRGAYTCGIA